jgi:hypothetical protein
MGHSSAASAVPLTATTSGTLRSWADLARAEHLLRQLAEACSREDVRRVSWHVETSTSEEWHPGEPEPRVRIITRPAWTEAVTFHSLYSWGLWESNLTRDTPHRRALLALWALCLPGGEFQLDPRPEDEPERVRHEETAA